MANRSQQHRVGALDVALERLQPLCAHGSIDDPVVAAEGHHHHAHLGWGYSARADSMSSANVGDEKKGAGMLQG